MPTIERRTVDLCNELERIGCLDKRFIADARNKALVKQTIWHAIERSYNGGYDDMLTVANAGK